MLLEALLVGRALGPVDVFLQRGLALALLHVSLVAVLGGDCVALVELGHGVLLSPWRIRVAYPTPAERKLLQPASVFSRRYRKSGSAKQSPTKTFAGTSQAHPPMPCSFDSL